MTHGEPVLCSAIRNGSGEDRRAGVQDRRGRRGGVVRGGTNAARKRSRRRRFNPFFSFSQVQGDNSSDRDLNAVQRGDAEMEQKMNRALRACLERSGGNPICSIHDQGAGGNGGERRRSEESQPPSAFSSDACRFPHR